MGNRTEYIKIYMQGWRERNLGHYRFYQKMYHRRWRALKKLEAQNKLTTEEK